MTSIFIFSYPLADTVLISASFDGTYNDESLIGCLEMHLPGCCRVLPLKKFEILEHPTRPLNSPRTCIFVHRPASPEAQWTPRLRHCVCHPSSPFPFAQFSLSCARVAQVCSALLSTCFADQIYSHGDCARCAIRQRLQAQGKSRSSSDTIAENDFALEPVQLTCDPRLQPCCVCKEEKAKRDECMLFSNAKDPAADCKSLVDQYKSCMVGYGFKI